MKNKSLVALGILLVAIVGCGGSDDDPAAATGTAGSGGASAGSSGAGGSKAGTGGASAGKGGTSAGSGGTSAGAGGTSAGAGGTSAGAGGTSAGAGGTSAGAGGTSAGAGGTSAGAGGTSAGAGGATAGSAGAAGSVSCSGGAAGAPSGCNTIVNGGSLVGKTDDAGPTPVGTGGTITDGRYYLTEFRAYAGSPITMFSEKQTLEFSCGGTVAQFISEKAGGTFHKNMTTSPVGTAPNVATTCSTDPMEFDLMYSSYTATSTTFTLYSAAFKFSGTFTKP